MVKPCHAAFNPLGANPTKWSNTLKQFVGNLPTNCLSVFDHFVILALKWLTLLDLLKLCVGFCLSEKMGESISFSVSPTHLKSILAFAVWTQFLRHVSWNLIGNCGSEKVYVCGPPSFAKVLKHRWI